MEILECMYGWTTNGDVKVGRWPDPKGWSDEYEFTGGACYRHWHKMSPEMQALQIFIEFNTMIVRDGVDPQKAHKEFLKIRPYRRLIAPDIQGAEVD